MTFSFVSVKIKWNANNIVDFLKIYEQHPVLWNTKHKDYCNTKLKDELFKLLYEQLAAKGLMEGMDEKQLKSKLKQLRMFIDTNLPKLEEDKKLAPE